MYPALALTALAPAFMERGYAARYNPKSGRFSIEDWKLVAGAVRRRAEQLSLDELSEWADQTMLIPKPTKNDQDRLDAAICLIVALQWRFEQDTNRLAVIGDGQTGYMVTPVSERTREILREAAHARSVPVGTPRLY